MAALISAIFTDLSIYVSLAIFIMIFIISLAYMFSKLLKNPKLEAWAKVEATELVKNVVLAMFIIGLYSILQFSSDYMGVNSGLFSKIGFTPTGGTRSKTIVAVTHVLNKIVYERAIPVLVKIADTYNFVEFVAGYREDWGSPKAVGYSVTSYPGAKVFSSALSWSMYIMSGVYVSLISQIVGLNLIYDISMKFLLPFGFILRFFPPLRSSGDEMIGMALSFGAILPFLYLLMFVMILDVESLNGMEHMFASSGESVIVNFISSMGVNKTSAVLRFVVNSALNIISILKYVVYGPFFVYLYPIILKVVFADIGYLAAIAIMIPTFLYMISASFIRAIKAVLNFEIER